MRLEVQSRKARSPIKAIVGAVTIVLALSGAVVYKMRADNQAELQLQRADRLRFEQETAKREQEQRIRFERELSQKQAELATAKSADERARLEKEVEQARAREQARRARALKAPTSPSRPAVPPTIRKPRDFNDDPLDGLKL
jgi:hypothetical protein